MRFFMRKRNQVLSKILPNRNQVTRNPHSEDELVSAEVGKTTKHDKSEGTSGKKGKASKKKKKKKSKKEKEQIKSLSPSSKLVDRVPTVNSYDSDKSEDLQEGKSRRSRYETDDVPVAVTSDDDGDDRYSVAGHLSRGGRSSAGVSVLSDDSDEYGARWRSWDDDDYSEKRDSAPTDDERETKDETAKKKKKQKHKSKHKSEKKKKKSKKSKSKRSEDNERDQPEYHENHSTIESKQDAVLSDPEIQVHGATTTDGQEHSLIEEIEIEHLVTLPPEMDMETETETEQNKSFENPVERCQEEEIDTSDDTKKDSLPYTRSIIPDDTFEVDNEVENEDDNAMITSTQTNKKSLLELDEYSVHPDLENQSALAQCLRFYSCNGIARLIESQPKQLHLVTTDDIKDSNGLPTTSANQSFELLLGVKSPIASGTVDNTLVRGDSEDSLDKLNEAPSLDMIKRNPSVVVDLTGKNLLLDDESVEDSRSRKTGQGSRHRKRTPKNNEKVTVTSIEIPEVKVSSVNDSVSHTFSYLGINSKSSKSAKSLSGSKSDKSVKSLPLDKKTPKRGHWLQRRHSNADDRSVRSVRSVASSKGSTSARKKRVAQSFFLRMSGRRAQC